MVVVKHADRQASRIMKMRQSNIIIKYIQVQSI